MDAVADLHGASDQPLPSTSHEVHLSDHSMVSAKASLCPPWLPKVAVPRREVWPTTHVFEDILEGMLCSHQLSKLANGGSQLWTAP